MLINNFEKKLKNFSICGIKYLKIKLQKQLWGNTNGNGEYVGLC